MSTRRRVLQTLVGFAMFILGVSSSVYGWFELLALLPLLGLVVVVDALFPTPTDARVEQHLEQLERLQRLEQATSTPGCPYCRHDEVELGLLGGVCPQCSLQATHRAMSEPAQPRPRRRRRRAKKSVTRNRRARPLTRPTLTPRTTPSMRCSFCRDLLESHDHRECAACNTQLHEACWSESGGCVTLGCTAPPPSLAHYRAKVAEPVLDRRRA